MSEQKAKKKRNKTMEEIVVDGKKVVEKIEWKVYFDTRTNKPVGAGYAVYVSAPDENLPALKDHPPYIEERKAVMLILDK